MSNVITLKGVTKLDLPPDRILEAAIGQLEGAVIIGYDVEGNEYFASSYSDRGKILWLLERMKKMLLEMNE